MLVLLITINLMHLIKRINNYSINYLLINRKIHNYSIVIPNVKLISTTQCTRNTNQGITSSFYDSLTQDDLIGDIVNNTEAKSSFPGLAVTLFPFQKEGVRWMAGQEKSRGGGIMADHLGMGKTIQMIALCLSTLPHSRLFPNKNMPATQLNMKQESSPIVPLYQNNTKSLGYKYWTVVQQMLKINSIGNCSALTRPGESLFSILDKIEIKIKNNSSCYQDVQASLNPWFQLSAKHHPMFTEKANAFIENKSLVPIQEIISNELRTLIVVPASLLKQWISELKLKVNINLKIHSYYQSGRQISKQELELFDFVITTYDTVIHDAYFDNTLAKKGKKIKIVNTDNKYGPNNHKHINKVFSGTLFQVQWKRIILDEAHIIRNSSTSKWKVVSGLNGINKWIVTATPLHNSINDLQNYLHFIGAPNLPILNQIPKDQLMKDTKLQHSIAKSLQPLLLRRNPTIYLNNNKIELIKLPPKYETVVWVDLDKNEIQRYNSFFMDTTNTLRYKHHIQQFSFAFSVIIRLRQLCCHPWLVANENIELIECSLCYSDCINPIRTECNHFYCRECLTNQFLLGDNIEELDENGISTGNSITVNKSNLFRRDVNKINIKARIPCSVCASPIPYSLLTEKNKNKVANLMAKPWESSSKLKSIIKSIHSKFEMYPEDKIIVFSFFTSFLDIISIAFQKENIMHSRLDGTMPLAERDETLRIFSSIKSIKVLLASKTAIGLGLNITAANHVLIVDPWWNPAIEEQSIHRCHRIGQIKPVYVERHIVQHSIEAKCYEVCQNKKEVGDSVLHIASGSSSHEVKESSSFYKDIISKLHIIS